MIVEIPLHPISKKIMAVENIENGIITIKKGDPLGVHLSFKYKSPKQKFKSRKAINQITKIQIPAPAYQNIREHLGEVGFNIYRTHKQRILNFIWGYTSGMNTTATAAIKLLYQRYAISEDDLPQETIYRAWQRYQRKLRKNATKSATNSPHHESDRVADNESELIEYRSIKAIDQKIAYIAANHKIFFGPRVVSGGTKKSYLIDMMIFAYHSELNMKVKDLSEIFSLHRSRIPKRRKAFIRRLDKNPDFKKLYFEKMAEL